MKTIKKSNDLIQSKFSLGKNEQKILLYILSKIKVSDKEFISYKITQKEILKYTGISKSRVYEDKIRHHT